MSDVDPVTFSVVRNGLKKICDEMDIALKNTAFSPVISEGRDLTNGIYDVTGDMVAQGNYGLPIFIGIMHFTVHDVIDTISSFKPGDVVIVNDPYHGGSHLMDVRMVRPFFYEDELFGFLANTGHWTDIGGMVPGGFSPTSTEIFQEGLALPPVKILDGGEYNQAVVDIIMNNVRVADQQRGDLEAQLSALRTGEERYRDLLDTYGVDVVRVCKTRSRGVAEAKVRAILSDLPDGAYTAEDYMDSDGIVDEPVRISLEMTIAGEEATFDFTGSSPFCEGPINSNIAVTKSSVYIALKHVYPEIPMNSGFFEPLSIVVPDDSFLNAKKPKPVAGAAAETSQRIVDVGLQALSAAEPDRAMGNPFGSVMNLGIGGTDPNTDDENYVIYQYLGGGYGGSHGRDGLTHGPPTIGVSKTQPIETLEARYPVRFDRSDVHSDSGGPGTWRGGLGVEHRIVLLRGTATASVLGDRCRFGPKGFDTGENGGTAAVTFVVDGDRFVPKHRSKIANVKLSAGDEIHIKTAGGGGFRNPYERSPERVKRDVENGVVSREDAANRYGVVLTTAGEIDEEATTRRRSG